MKFSERFKINVGQFEIDFVDINLKADIRLFLDPYFISKTDSLFAQQAYKTVEDFFEHVLFLLNLKKDDEVNKLF